MTLRDATDRGFPPRDHVPSDLLSGDAKDSMEYERRCSAFFVSVFKTLEGTIQEICTKNHDALGCITFSQCMEAWQDEFGSLAPRRREIFARVQDTFDDVCPMLMTFSHWF
jgi:hypothetical protein